jgi:hypothetical protein
MRNKNVRILPSLIETINSKCYFHTLVEAIDMQILLRKCMVENISLNNLMALASSINFVPKNIDGKTLIWGKEYSSSSKWEPSSGLSFLKFIPCHQTYA